MEPDDDDVVGERAAGETGTGSPWNEWQPFFSQKAHHRDRLLAVAWENRETRLATIAGKPIGVVNQQLALTAEDVPLAHDFGQTLCDRGLSPRDRLGHS